MWRGGEEAGGPDLDVCGEFAEVGELHCADAIESDELLLLFDCETVDHRMLAIFDRVQLLDGGSHTVSGGGVCAGPEGSK